MKKESKTGRIRDYLRRNPGQVFTPKEVASLLGYDVQIITSILNRMERRGELLKSGRGQYHYQEDDSIIESPANEFALAPEDVSHFFQELWGATEECLGSAEMAYFSARFSWNEDSPVQSISEFLQKLLDALGETSFRALLHRVLAESRWRMNEELALYLLNHVPERPSQLAPSGRSFH